MSADQKQARREEFMARFDTDEEFRREAIWVFAAEVEELRNTLRRIGNLRRGDFLTGFHYEVAVHEEVDHALRRLDE